MTVYRHKHQRQTASLNCVELISLDVLNSHNKVVLYGLTYEIYSGGSPSTYVYCVVYYRVIAAPYVRSVGCVFALSYTLVDNSECPWTMSSLYS